MSQHGLKHRHLHFIALVSAIGTGLFYGSAGAIQAAGPSVLLVYLLGGAVVYTRDARRVLMDIPDEAMKGIRSASEPYAELLARQIRTRFATDWGLSETGAAGPTGNRYGDAAGHACCAVAGPATAVVTLESGRSDRFANMQLFARSALELLLTKLDQ